MKNHVLRIAAQGISGALLLAAMAASGPLRAAEVKFMIEPQYPPDKAQQVFKPLADYLTATTGHKVVLMTPRNYHFFWRDLRQNTPVDFVFEEAHFTDYHVTHYKAEPLVKTAENTSYSLLGSDQLKAPTLDALIGRSIVTMPSPSLGFALLIEFFPNPVSQPNILSSAASWRDGVETVFAGEADAAIVPTWLRDQYPNLLTIRTSRAFPGAAVSAMPNVDPKVKQDIKVALLKLHENQQFYSVLSELGTTKFVETNAAEYDGSQKMLRGFFGYQAAPVATPLPAPE